MARISERISRPGQHGSITSSGLTPSLVLPLLTILALVACEVQSDLLKYMSLVGWDNVTLYGEYEIPRDLADIRGL